MTTETILTDEQMHEMWDMINASFGREIFRCSHYDFARAIEQAVLQSPEIQALRRLSEALEEKIEMYDRYGPTCKFEGDPMIHAIHLEELRDAAMEQTCAK